MNKKLNARERGGSLSKCFTSDLREKGLTASKINNRCYYAVCSITGNYLFILLGSSIVVCYAPGQTVKAPFGLDGEVKCPSIFDNYCQNK